MTGGNIARDDVLDLLGRCTVELWHPQDRENRRASGFFIAPGVVLTCAHVIAACSERPMVRAGDTAVRAKASIVSQASRPAEHSGHYTGFPDMALVYVSFDEHPCVWLDRRILTKGADLTAVTRFDAESAEQAPDPRPILLRYQQETATTAQSKLWLTAPPREISTEFRGLRITKGTSGSPVLDDRTLRVIGMVNASDPRGDFVHVVPVVSGLAAFSALLHDGAAAEAGDLPAAPPPNPVIEAWYAHDRYHGRADQWPGLAQRDLDAQSPGEAPASVQVLPPRFEQRLLNLLAEVGAPWIDAEPERLYRRSVGEPEGPVTPGPIHTLRDAAWHLAAMDATGNALSTLARCVLEKGTTDVATAKQLRQWAADYDRLRGRAAQAPLPSAAAVQTAGWPAAVMVRLTPAYSKVGSYRGSVWSRDAQGNWTSATTGERRPARVDAALDAVKEDVRAALGKLVHQNPILEFSVPQDLFDHPFDTWDLFNGRPVSELHPVVVRDEEVLEDVNVHGYAEQKWERVQQTSGHPPFAVRCGDLPDTSERAVLFRDRFSDPPLPSAPDLSGRLVLLPGPVTPPGSASHAMLALRALWTPMVLWSRNPCPRPHFYDESFDPADPPCPGAHFTTTAGLKVDGVPPEQIPAKIKALRERARQVRRLVAAGQAGPEWVNEDNPLLTAAVLLWDPPNRLPVNFLLAAPGAAV